MSRSLQVRVVESRLNERFGYFKSVCAVDVYPHCQIFISIYQYFNTILLPLNQQLIFKFKIKRVTRVKFTIIFFFGLGLIPKLLTRTRGVYIMLRGNTNLYYSIQFVESN